MRFVAFVLGDSNVPQLGVELQDGELVNLSATADPRFGDLRALIEAGPQALSDARSLVAHSTERIGRDQYRLAAPLPRPTQFRDSMCFFQHIEQCARVRLAPGAAYELPAVYRQQPVYYIGNRLNVSAPGDTIRWPDYSKLMDFELELACVIGTRCKDLTPDSALDQVFGFTIFNDFSARDAQAIEMQGMLGPAKGKHFDGANVFGPCVVTLDEIGDPQRLRMQSRVNGETWCDSSSATMNWTFAQLLTHISAGETLYPGEIIASGTVGGGCGLERLRFLQSGDVVELEIEKIGVLRNRVVM